MSRSKVQYMAVILVYVLSPMTVVCADHIQGPPYRDMETTESRTITTSPLSGMVLYRIEHKGHVAVAYRICREQQELFPFAIAEFAQDTLYLDQDRDGHLDEMIVEANLPKRSLTEDLPSCTR